MRYLGGKAKVAKRLAAELESRRPAGGVYVEPFLGGCNVLPRLDGPRWGNEINASLIMFYEALRGGWVPPDHVSEEEYKALQHADDSALRGFVGIACSWGGKWFGGYARDHTGRNYALNGYNGAIKLAPRLQGVHLTSLDYRDMQIAPGCLVYCDPPYAGTTKYSGEFDSAAFWQWARELSQTRVVLVSEYAAPPDFTCVWSLERDCGISGGKNSATGTKRVERLFQLTK